MNTASRQVTDFFSSVAPFEGLDSDMLTTLARRAVGLYLTDTNADDLTSRYRQHLFVIQSGQFVIHEADEPVRHVSEGACFGYAMLLDGVSYPLRVEVNEPGLVYCIDEVQFSELLEVSTVANFFQRLGDDELQQQAVTRSESVWLYRSLSEVVQRAPVMVNEQATIVEAARVMTENGVSSLLVTCGEAVVGVVTDRDLRSRVVAREVDVGQPIATIMTRSPVVISEQDTLFDTLATMSERNIHHLPVVDTATGKPVGMVTVTDIIRQQRGNVLFIIGELAKADCLYTLTRAAWQLPHYFATHARRPGDVDIIGRVLSQATDMITRKLISFFEQANGPAPMPFSWLVFGSQARQDQTLGSDQDNGLLLADTPTDTQADYFQSMGTYVCEGLAKCGIKRCTGNIMASNPALRLSLDAAVKDAQGWVSEPASTAIMHCNIFLDVRTVAGDLDLFETLQRRRAPLFRQRLFLAALARHASEAAVPLSLFRRFVCEKDAQGRDVIDLKVRGVAIINNIVRLYALAEGLTMPSTLSRLKRLSGQSELSLRDRDNLRDIWLFLNRLRWRHQLQNNLTDNKVPLSELSAIEKHQLKAAFRAIEIAQEGAVMAFSGGMR
ncbi:DUF294 nucleotidyltransferase-like domain-containing protein [Alteromonas sp. ASW11-19]|uniref:DUF294 nucleotidyltransferase-like domain-containing protein n=1 Tax=Alteromonas salexigens TaxID=2982530 RepID=A0ABT2VK89_9ALTE|nr:DUF294 nucleotidyltransferase-like domain-containing protein [Alteromonas salexigens]MCU7553686.1 DUF294 nucleotidyltransferase-like domain-containing protein [Alteromonas salexigens]